MNLSQVNATLSTRSAAVEKRVLEAYGSTLEAKFPSALTLLAVGGFGRRELFPNSDVDLLILIESENQLPSVKETLSNFLQALWDSGLRPSHSVHTVADCVTEHEQNAELTISLLDHRRLAGDAALFDTLDQKFETFIHRRGEAIARQLATLAVERRAKFQNTIYHLEPNVKDTPGGLRDLQTVRWLAILHPREVPRGLDEAFAFLSAIRIRLHELSGRDQNILTFDAQDSLSQDPAELMRDYYRHARLVDRAARYAMERSSEQPGSLLGRFHDWRSRLSNSEFSVVRDQVLLRTSNILPADLSLFMFAARHRLRLAPDTVDRLHGFVPHATWDAWKQLLGLPHASYGLRAMQECGALAALLPEWRKIECLSRARFLSSLHRGRTHARRHRRSGIGEGRPLRRVVRRNSG